MGIVYQPFSLSEDDIDVGAAILNRSIPRGVASTFVALMSSHLYTEV